MLRPPSTARVWPVMKDAASEARKAIVSATSFTSPTRPMAWVVLECSRKSCQEKCILWQPFHLKWLGCTAIYLRKSIWLLFANTYYIKGKLDCCIMMQWQHDMKYILSRKKLSCGILFKVKRRYKNFFLWCISELDPESHSDIYQLTNNQY